MKEDALSEVHSQDVISGEVNHRFELPVLVLERGTATSKERHELILKLVAHIDLRDIQDKMRSLHSWIRIRGLCS